MTVEQVLAELLSELRSHKTEVLKQIRLLEQKNSHMLSALDANAMERHRAIMNALGRLEKKLRSPDPDGRD